MAEFLSLVEHGERFYSRKGIDVAFAERVAQVWEDDGPSSHGAQVSARELLTSWPGHVEHPDAAWLLPLLRRWEAGDDPGELREEAVAAYVDRHGVEPRSFLWEVRIP